MKYLIVTGLTIKFIVSIRFIDDGFLFFVLIGGVVSGLGKGITISSIGVLLKSAGYSVTSIKIDPYLVRPSIALHMYSVSIMFQCHRMLMLERCLLLNTVKCLC